MSGARCQVDRARVFAGSADDGPRWRFLIDDALRTAEFGDAGRLLLVRRLRLSGLPARPGPGQAARALEVAWAAQARLAVPALAAGAADAPAVWFASHLAAQAAWLAAWADDDRAVLAAWYWPAALEYAVPSVPTGASPAVAAAIWRAAEAAAPGAWRQAVADWPDLRLAVLARRWAGAGVLPAPAPGDGDPTPVAPSPLAEPEDDAPPTGERAAIARVVARLRALPPGPALPAPARAWLAGRWLAQALARPEAPMAAVQRALAGVVPPAPQALHRWPAPGPSAPARGGAVAPGPPRAAAEAGRAPTAAAAPEPERRAAALVSGLPPAARRAAPPAPVGPPAVSRPPALQRLVASRPWLAEGAPTAHGGLLLLLNLLPRLGFPAWREVQPDAAAIVDALFLHLLDATGAPPDDPQRRCFGGAVPADAPRALRAWRLRIRRALRRQVRIDLGALVRRPALVQATATHLDLVFPLEDVDLRLRRAGLDLDPGWVPWFGRIVSFHYH